MLLKRPGGIGSIEQVIRMALAATLAWAIATSLTQSTLGIFAPITALMVVQSSPLSAFGVSLQRILGTSAGVLFASIYVNIVGLRWWSFLVGILAALLVARLLPFSVGGQLQIPIAVIFVLALGPGSLDQDMWRVIDVFIGGAIGLLAVMLWPNRPPVGALRQALAKYRDEQVALLQGFAPELDAEPLQPGMHHDFLAQARELRSQADQVRESLVSVAEATHLNLRGRHVRAELPEYAVTFQRLSNIGLQIRGMATMANALYGRGIDPKLTAEQFVAFTAELAKGLTFAAGADEVLLSGEAGQWRDEALGDQLRNAAATAVEVVGSAGPVLESISLIGRIDFTRQQIAAYAAGTPIDLSSD